MKWGILGSLYHCLDTVKGRKEVHEIPYLRTTHAYEVSLPANKKTTVVPIRVAPVRADNVNGI